MVKERNNGMKKILYSNVLIYLVVTILLTDNVRANTETLSMESPDDTNFVTDTEEHIVDKNISIVNDEGDEIFFTNIEDKKKYLQQQGLKRKTRAIGVSRRTEKMGSNRYKMKFAGYSNTTPNWTKAKQYRISKNKGVKFGLNASYKGVGVKLGFSKVYGTTIVIPANSKKYSKLAGYQDVTLTKYRTIYYQADRRIQTINHVTKKVHANYVKVKYK